MVPGKFSPGQFPPGEFPPGSGLGFGLGLGLGEFDRGEFTGGRGGVPSTVYGIRTNYSRMIVIKLILTYNENHYYKSTYNFCEIIAPSHILLKSK